MNLCKRGNEEGNSDEESLKLRARLLKIIWAVRKNHTATVSVSMLTKTDVGESLL